MTPSSKVGRLGIAGAAAFCAVFGTMAGEAGAAGRAFGGGAAMHMRPAARLAFHPSHAGDVRARMPGGRLAGGRLNGGLAYAAPGYFDGTFPTYAPGTGDYALVAPPDGGRVPPSPVLYPVLPPGATGPRAVCAALPKPGIIEVTPSRPARKLPRVVYGTSSLCQG